MSWLASRQSLLLVICGAATATLLQLEPLNDVDIYWQVRLGQLMLEQGRLITEDPFTFTHAGQPVPTLAWLAQILYALMYDNGGWRAVQLLHALLFAGAFVICGATALFAARPSAPAGLFSLGAALFLGWVAAASNSMVRPQSFGVFCFALLLLLARGRARLWRKTALAIPILLLWVNTHPSAVIGGLAVGALAVAGWVRRWRSAAAAPWDLTVLGGLVLLAPCATPMGWNIFSTSAANVRVARDWLRVSEWLPPWDPAVQDAMLGFAVVLAVTVALLVVLRGRVALADWLLFVVMTALALSAARFVLFWAAAMVPVWVGWIEQARPPGISCRAATTAVRKPVSAAVTVCCFMVVALPAAFRPAVVDEFALADGIATLRKHVPQGRIYNFREWGGPLILAGHPRWRVAIDGRLYLFGRDDWHDYQSAALGQVPVRRLEDRYRPDAFFLRPRFHDKLIALLRESPNWREAYRDRNCCIFVH